MPKITRISKAARIAAALSTLVAGTGLAQSQPSEVLIPGTIRDFHSLHPDFGINSSGGTAVTGLAELSLGSNNRPAWLGAGNELVQDALDADSMPIAPHLFDVRADGGDVLMLVSDPIVSGMATFDSWDPDLGPYDPATAEPLPDIETVKSIDPIVMPTFTATKVASMDFGNKSGNKSTLLTGEYWTDEFWVGGMHVLEIQGNVVIRADVKFEVRNQSQIVLLPGATLEIYIGGTFMVENISKLNEIGGDHNAVTVYNFGTEDMYIENTATMIGTIIAPDATVITQNTSDLYGAVNAAGMEVDNTSGFHAAGEFTWFSGCFAEGDTQPAAGVASTGQVFAEGSFNQWFRDVPGVNLAQFHQMFLKQKGSAYEFSTSSWEPINDQLYGNEGDSANRGFTFAAHVVFDHLPCDQRYIEIESGMDVWVYIDGRLAIDLGGTTGNHYQRIQLDRLAIEAGRHDLHLFIAQRAASAQNFRMNTTVPLMVPRGVAMRQGPQHD